MKHWFISWLEKEAEHCIAKVEKYRRANDGDIEGINLRRNVGADGILELKTRSEEDAQRFKKWVEVASDMINCGLEQEAVAYYDAKQSIEPHLLPPRPKSKELKAVCWTLDGITEQLEQRIEEANDKYEREQLQAVYFTICEMVGIGKNELAIEYYLIAKQKYQELILPEAEYQEDNN